MTDTFSPPTPARLTRESVLSDYALGWRSRQASLIGRREVLTGKAKFGIFGDGKEVAQLAMARAFRTGDFRSGYYRDQTFMLAIWRASTSSSSSPSSTPHADLDARARFGRPPDERPLRHAPAQSGRHLAT